jgi:hypothetical protein
MCLKLYVYVIKNNLMNFVLLKDIVIALLMVLIVKIVHVSIVIMIHDMKKNEQKQ